MAAVEEEPTRGVGTHGVRMKCQMWTWRGQERRNGTIEDTDGNPCAVRSDTEIGVMLVDEIVLDLWIIIGMAGLESCQEPAY